MLSKIEKLGDRLLSAVVPHADASALCCMRIGICDRTRDWWLCNNTHNVAIYRCSAYDPGDGNC